MNANNTQHELRKKLRDARDVDTAIAALWQILGAGGDPPPSRKIAAWIAGNRCPPQVLMKCDTRLFPLWANAIPNSQRYNRWRSHWSLVTWGCSHMGDLCVWSHHAWDDNTEPHSDHPYAPLEAWARVATEADTKKVAPPKHPLAPVVKVWRDRPKRVEAETNPARRLLPDLRKAHVGNRSGLVGKGVGAAQADSQLPIIEGVSPHTHHVSVLDVADQAKMPVMAKGRGLPLPARVMLYALLSVPPRARTPEQGVEIQTTLRAVARRMWPGTKLCNRNLLSLLHAIEALGSYRILLPDGGWWCPAMMRGHLSPRLKLDSTVVFSVAYPPGSGRGGPPVDLPKLWELAARSGPRCRAYIAAHTLNWRPGSTRVPVGRRGMHVWSNDVSRYPVLSPADRRRLAFGPQDKGDRRRASIDTHWKDLPGVVWSPVGDDGGARQLPREIADESHLIKVANRTKKVANRTIRPSETRIKPSFRSRTKDEERKRLSYCPRFAPLPVGRGAAGKDKKYPKTPPRAASLADRAPPPAPTARRRRQPGPKRGSPPRRPPPGLATVAAAA